MPEATIDIVRSKRRTLAIEITDTAQILVRAPRCLAQRDIDRFIAENSRWISRKYNEAQRRFLLQQPKEFREGGMLPLLGASYPIVRLLGSTVHFDNYFILPEVSEGKRVEKLEAWYRKYAREHFADRTEHFAKMMDVSFSQVRLSSARSRWGSCSSKGSINLNWRLIMAPSPVIDYVIVHELSHMTYMNHSKRFWSRVSAFYPDHVYAKAWLNEYGMMLSLA